MNTINTMNILLIITTLTVVCGYPSDFDITISGVPGNLEITGDTLQKLANYQHQTGIKVIKGTEINDIINNNNQQQYLPKKISNNESKKSLSEQNNGYITISNQGSSISMGRISMSSGSVNRNNNNNMKHSYNSSCIGKIQNILFIFCIIISVISIF